MKQLLLIIMLLLTSLVVATTHRPPVPVKKDIVLEEKDDSEFAYTDREVYLMACAIYSEARGETYWDNRCVASVILNRMYDDNFPNTIEGVIFHENENGPEFDGVNTPSFYVHLDKEAWRKAQRAAKDILTNGSISTKFIFYLNEKTSTDKGWVRTLKRKYKKYLDNENHSYYGYKTVS